MFRLVVAQVDEHSSFGGDREPVVTGEVSQAHQKGSLVVMCLPTKKSISEVVGDPLALGQANENGRIPWVQGGAPR